MVPKQVISIPSSISNCKYLKVLLGRSKNTAVPCFIFCANVRIF